MELWFQNFIELLPSGALYLLILFLIAFAEALPLFGLAVPGSTLAVFAGYLVIHGKGTLFSLIATHCCGAVLGDVLSFWLGLRYGGKLLHLRGFQKHRQWLKRAQEFFIDHGGKSIFFARFIGPIRGITPFIAGLSGMAGRPFLFYALVSGILWGLSYPTLGYLGGQSWHRAQNLSSRFALLVFVALAATILHHRIRKAFKSNNGPRNR